MINFDPILVAAIERAGGEDDLAARLPGVKSASELKAVPDHRYFSQMSLRIFRAGLKHSLVDGKWPAFEDVFYRFDPYRVRAMPDEAIEALLGNSRIIRHLGKLRAVHANAVAMCDVIEENGSFGVYLANWDGTQIGELWDDITKRFKQMGGGSTPYFLRMVGKDSFTMSPYVCRGLAAWGALESEPKGKTGRRQAQEIFNAWAEETGRPLAELSMILAIATD